MNTNIRIVSLLVVVLSVLAAGVVLAVSKNDIVYPVAELNNCENEQACRAYCDDSANIEQCIAFAEQHNLIAPQELEKAKKFRDLGAVGPGGCTSERECEAYCENINNIDECLVFAEEHGFMEPEELAEAKKIQAALRSGVQFPSGCTSKSSCETYCSAPQNMRECVEFAEAAELMSERELKEAKQVLKALDAGVPLPGNCQGEKECEAYCEDAANAEECVNFAIAAGFIPPEEAEEARRMISFMREGRMPEACRQGREACEAYCAEPENAEECTTFFVEAGFMSQEEAELFRKTGGRGPGGCQGERECEEFCNNPTNQQICFEFGKEHGLISDEELRGIEEGVGQLKEMLASAPPEVAQCLRDEIGQERINKIQAGTLLPGPETGNKMQRCFELQQQVIENQLRDCLNKSCDEVFSCLESVQQFGAPPGEAPEGEFAPGGGQEDPFAAINQEISAKIESCFAQEGGGEFPGGGLPQGFEPEQKTPEQVKCIEGIIGFVDNPRSPEEERQIAEECFGAEFGPPPGFEGEGSRGDLPAGEEGFQQQFQQGFEGVSPEEIEQRIQQEEERFRQEEEQRIREQFEQEAFEQQRLQIEQQLQEQFQQESFPEGEFRKEDFQEFSPEETQGNILEAAANLFLRLIPR